MTNPYDPAFTDHPISDQVWTGLTKREYFAAMAMQGLLSSDIPESTGNTPADRRSYLARTSIQIADALIAELNK